MIRTTIATGLSILILILAEGTSDAADREAAAARAAPWLHPVKRVQDCSKFYDPYRTRGFGWGSGPGLDVPLGMFEGALPAYPMNSFPNWYFLCETWGHYSAAGSAPR